MTRTLASVFVFVFILVLGFFFLIGILGSFLVFYLSYSPLHLLYLVFMLSSFFPKVLL